MADTTIHGLANDLVTPGPNDEVGIWNLVTSRYEKIKRSNLVGANITGGGTIVLGGFTFTIPATGTAALAHTEGTWTPALTFGGGATGMTYAIQVGRWVRSGNIVHAWGFLSLTNKGSDLTQVRVTNLPFSAKNLANYNQAVTIRLDGLTGVSGNIQGFIAPAAAVIRIEHLGTGTAAELQSTHFTNTSSVMIDAVYEV